MDSLQWEEYLEYYYQQKSLEKYQQKRTLSRPRITKLTVGIYTAILLFVISGFCVALFMIFDFKLWMDVIIILVYSITMLESFGRLLSIKIVECYQHYASEQKRRRCKCVPSCSEYAILCLKKYELIYALLKIRKRLFVTCKGFDYIIDEP